MAPPKDTHNQVTEGETTEGETTEGETTDEEAGIEAVRRVGDGKDVSMGDGHDCGDGRSRGKEKGREREEGIGGDGESDTSTGSEFENIDREWDFSSLFYPEDDSSISPPLTSRQLSHSQADTYSPPEPRKSKAGCPQERRPSGLNLPETSRQPLKWAQKRQLPWLNPSETPEPLQERVRKAEAAKKTSSIFQNKTFCWSHPLRYKLMLTSLDFFPANKSGPRKLRIQRTIENGAVWTKDFDNSVTHIIAEKVFSYQEILHCLGVSSLPTQIFVVNEDYLSDCIGLQTLLNPIHPQYHIKGSRETDQAQEDNNKVWDGNNEVLTKVQMLLRVINGDVIWGPAQFENLVQEYGTRVAPLPKLLNQSADALDGVIMEVQDMMATLLKTMRSDPTIQKFMNVYGVGYVTASKWKAQGHRTLEDLRSHTCLSTAQWVGLNHYEDFNSPIPCDEIPKHEAYLRDALNLIDSRIQLRVAGSYRRGARECADIDFLITASDLPFNDFRRHIFKELIPALESLTYIKCTLAAGLVTTGKLWRGAAVLPRSNSSIWRRIDIYIIPEEEMGAALWYYTGSRLFNRSMELLATRHGMHLNMQGLWNENGTVLIERCSERRIFELLGVRWRSPDERML